MSRTLSATGQALVYELPGFYSEDSITQAVQDALGREIDRLDAALVALVSRFSVPQNAQDDTYGSLRYWEALLNLPVAPAGVSVATRVTNLLARFRQRSAGKGTDWVSLLTQAIGTNQWTYQEGPAAYTIVITLPQTSTSYTAAQVSKFAADITPAHLVLSYSLGSGSFTLGFSAMGTPL